MAGHVCRCVWGVMRKKKVYKYWSSKNKLNACIECGLAKFRHKGNGLCLACFDKNRAKNPKRKAQLKGNHDRWYAKVKGTPEYIAYVNERAFEWRKTETYKAYLQRVYRRNRILNAVVGKRELKRHTVGIEIVCECCGKKVKTPFLPEELNNKMVDINLFRKYIRLKHQGILKRPITDLSPSISLRS